MGGVMDDSELANLIERKLETAINGDGSPESDARQKSLDYYLGELYGNERDGHSKVVTREVFEAVEWALPSFMRVFTAERVAVFIPEGVEDQAAAEQESDVVRHLLFDQENGYLALHNWTKDCLMYPVGYTKIWVEQVEKTTTERYRSLTLEQLVDLSESEGVELVAGTEIPGPDGLPRYDVEVKVTTTKPCLRFEAVPADEVRVSNRHRSVELDDCDFVSHVTKKTRSELLEMGIDAALLDKVGEGADDSNEAVNRDRFNLEDPDDESDLSLREYEVSETYLLVDYDGDGIAERRKVIKIGREIAENEEADYIPLVAMAAIIMPHQHSGIGYAESTQDLQLISSTLMRQLLTNLYRINQPRKRVGENALLEGSITMDALLDAAAELIPCRDPLSIVDEQIQSLAPAILPVMDRVDAQKQLRTGVNPNIALDADVLKQSTEGAFTKALDQASQRLELAIRGMAETGVKCVIRKAHRLIREHWSNELALQLRGEWVYVSPREWKERTNLKVSVGIGTRSKQERLAGAMMIAQLQEKLAPMRMVNPEHMFATAREIVEASGMEGAERFFVNPQKTPIQPAQPDPMMVAQIESLKAQGQAMMTDAQSKMARAQIEGMKAQLEKERAQFEASLKAREAELKAQIAQFEAQTSAGKAQSEVRHMDADTLLKQAQRVKTLEEARAIDLESDATESGVVEFLQGVSNG
jgi:hypothetical protein